jgi:hypothetical protein
MPTPITNPPDRHVRVLLPNRRDHPRHPHLLSPRPPRPLGPVPNGDHVVVIWPGGALSGRPVELARELDRLGDGQDDLDHAAALAIRQFLTDPAAQDGAVWSSAPARTWSTPAAASWLSGPSDQPGYGDQTSANRPGGPAPASRTTLPQPSRRRPEPPDPTRLMELGQHRRQRHR